MEHVIGKNRKTRNGVAIVGHLARSKIGADGQVLRTRIVVEELENRLGADRVRCVDTGAPRIELAATIAKLWCIPATCSDVVFMPGSRGLRFLLPLYDRWQRSGLARLHHLAVGGWLTTYLSQHPGAVERLRRCAGVYVQTRRLQTELRCLGFENTRLLPNFRRFPRGRAKSVGCSFPLRFVFLARVVPEKGVEHAVAAVSRLNNHCNSPATLDIWGPVADRDRIWFDKLLQNADHSVRYQGVLRPDNVHEKLVDYDVLIFPTFYKGEGFPGVILDAMIAGIPVVASDWQDNTEFIHAGANGLLFPTGNIDALTERLEWCTKHPEEIVRMKSVSAKLADAYHVDSVFPFLIAQMGV